VRDRREERERGGEERRKRERRERRADRWAPQACASISAKPRQSNGFKTCQQNHPKLSDDQI
jgi:hypothetical protein